MPKRMRIITSIALAGFLACAAAPFLAHPPVANQRQADLLPAPQPEPLTVETLEQWALERNPTLAQAAAQIGISQGRARGAGLYPNPSVGYIAEQIGAEGKAGELQGMFVEQEFVTAGKLRLSRAKYASEAQHFRVLSSVRRAFYHALVTQQQVLVRILLLSEDLPMVVEIVDKPERIAEFLPDLNGMIGEGLVTLERVRVIIYRHDALQS